MFTIPIITFILIVLFWVVYQKKYLPSLRSWKATIYNEEDKLTLVCTVRARNKSRAREKAVKNFIIQNHGYIGLDIMSLTIVEIDKDKKSKIGG